MPRYTRQSSEQPLYTHNTYSQMLAETGIAGALGFLILVVATGVTGWRFVARAPDPSTRALRQGFFAAWLTFTLAAGVDFGWFYLAGQIWWFVVSGLFIGASARAFARPPSAWIRMPLGFMVAGLIVCGSVLVLAANRFAVSGRRALEHGDLNQGVFQLEKAVRLTASPEDVQLLAEARRMRGGDRDLDRAATELEASLRDNPDHYPLYHRLGLVQSGHADPQAVFASFERAYRLDPMFHPEYAHNYAVALFRSGAGAQAMAVIDRTLEMYGRGPSLDPEYAAEIDRLMALRDELERRGAHR